MKTKYERIDTISVGDYVGLLPDDHQPRDSDQMEWHPNSTLELGPEPLTVSAIALVEDQVMIEVESSFKRLHLRRFYLIARNFRHS